MKTLRRGRRWLPWLIVSLACNVLTPGSGAGTPAAVATRTLPPPSAAVSTPGPTLAPSPTPEPLLPLASLTDNLRARIEAGEWTAEEGLVTTLKFFTGEATASDVNPRQEILNYEGTDIARLASIYLEAGKDEATKIELKRLLEAIFPDPERLKRYAAPAPAGGSASAARRARVNGQIVDRCLDLTRAGFPASDPVLCFEYRSINVAGQDYRLYYPDEWPDSDPRLAMAEPALEAVRASVETFVAYGPMPPAILIFSLLPIEAGDESTLALSQMSRSSGTCIVTIFPAVVSQDLGVFQQTLAHELFHCFQYRNFLSQSLEDANQWWFEGTAEYFGNVVYPEVNAEYEHLPKFDSQSATRSLVTMSYEAFVFFQYLGNTEGNEAVIRLIASMPSGEEVIVSDLTPTPGPDGSPTPTPSLPSLFIFRRGGGVEAQQRALAAYPNIEDIFHNFARAYLDRNIADSSGALIPVQPSEPVPITVDETRAYTLLVRNFVIHRYRLIFPADQRYTLTEEERHDLMSAARPMGGTEWSVLPSELAAGCERELLYLITGAGASLEVREPQIAAVVEAAEGTCDPCLVGTWQMDTASHWEAVMALISAAGRPELQSYTGAITLAFTDEGGLTQTLDNVAIHYTQDFGDAHAEAFISASGVIQSVWSTDGAGNLLIDNVARDVTSDAHTTFTTSGVTLTQPIDLPIGMGAGQSLYQCSDEALLIDPYTPAGVAGGQFITHHRVEP